MYITPQTHDGRILDVTLVEGGLPIIDVEFELHEAFERLVDGRAGELVFAARSRLGRLGIDVSPLGSENGAGVNGVVLDGRKAYLRATVEATVQDYKVGPLLPKLLAPGLRVGRLVFCPAERRLTSDQIFEELGNHELQLPASFSIGFDGRLEITSHRCIYRLAKPLDLDDAITIVARDEGKQTLNRLQVPEYVEHIVIPPRDAVITSCSMFLHRHYVVLDPESRAKGQHLQAVVLDPVSTRGTQVFLEFANDSERPIVNPTASASVYDAYPMDQTRSRLVRGWAHEPDADEWSGTNRELYDTVVERYTALEDDDVDGSYYRRLVAVFANMDALLGDAEPLDVWQSVPDKDVEAMGRLALARTEQVDRSIAERFGTDRLSALPDSAGVVLLLGYFPNLIEHTHICEAALSGKVRRIVFRRASFEHGPFLSARDQGRLADYHSLGVDVMWCNDARKHVAVHIMRGYRGFFMEPRHIDRFKTALIIAFYGSSKPLTREESIKVRELVIALRELFGDSIAVLTGGGPGAMQQATDVAQEMGLLVGASYIETVDQGTNETAEFYQTFQAISRHNRQRWFEVASFQIFFVGGVGTLEEVGQTLTDMKLGVIELAPLVFFGRNGDEGYWANMKRQLDVMVGAARAPDWLSTNLLVTDDPGSVRAFYKRVLQLA